MLSLRGHNAFAIDAVASLWVMGWQKNRRRGLCKLPNPLKGLPSCPSVECHTVDLLV